MPIVLAKCTECGGTIKVDSDKKLGVCENCGEPFVVEDAINNFTNYYETNYITNNNTTHNYSDGTVVNVYEDKNKDFVIEAGVLKEYHGESVDVVVPEGVLRIANNCFANMHLKTLVIPVSLEKDDDFFGDVYCERFEVNENNQYYSSQDGILFDKEKTILLRYPCTGRFSITFSYENAELTRIKPFDISKGEYKIPNSVVEINYYAFSGADLKNVVMSNNVKRIMPCAFENSAIESIELSNSLEVISYECFRGCCNLKEIIIPISVDEIESGAFTYCSSLSRVVIDNIDVKVYKDSFPEKIMPQIWKKLNKCSYCGGSFDYPLLGKLKCKDCGRKKDY